MAALTTGIDRRVYSLLTIPRQASNSCDTQYIYLRSGPSQCTYFHFTRYQDLGRHYKTVHFKHPEWCAYPHPSQRGYFYCARKEIHGACRYPCSSVLVPCERVNAVTLHEERKDVSRENIRGMTTRGRYTEVRDTNPGSKQQRSGAVGTSWVEIEIGKQTDCWEH